MPSVCLMDWWSVPANGTVELTRISLASWRYGVSGSVGSDESPASTAGTAIWAGVPGLLNQT